MDHEVDHNVGLKDTLSIVSREDFMNIRRNFFQVKVPFCNATKELILKLISHHTYLIKHATENIRSISEYYAKCALNDCLTDDV